MSLSFDPGSLGPVQGPLGPEYVIPVAGEETDIHDPTASTLSQSFAEALLVQLLPGWPILQQPDQQHALTVAGVTAMVGAEFARIGSEMWDSYLDYLAEQKERIQEYLESPAYRQHLEQHTLAGMVHQEIETGIDTESPVYNATEFNMYLNSRVENAVALWTSTIDGVSNYIQENRDDNPAAALFVATSFAITSTYIGDYMNIVDIASTDMVTVNPIQDAASHVLPMVPVELQQQYTMVINLFAIGLINFANAEAILRTGQEQQRPPTNWESVVTFAHQVLANCEGNTVNAYLLAMLVTNVEDLGPTPEQREQTISKLVILAKAMMIAVAVAALLKAATPDMPINGLIFERTMNGELVAQSEDDQRLVNELSPLIAYFNHLRAEGGMSEDFWDELMAALGDFFDDNPDTDMLVSPTEVYSALVKELFNSEIQG